MLFGRISFTQTILCPCANSCLVKNIPQRDHLLINYWRLNFVISSLKPWCGLHGFIAVFFFPCPLSSLCFQGHINRSECYLSAPLPHTAFWLHTHKWILDKHLCQNLVAASKLAITLHRLALSTHTHARTARTQACIGMHTSVQKALHKHMSSPP